MINGDNFSFTCNKCGSDKVYITTEGVYVVIICDGSNECQNKQNVLELFD